MITDRETIMAIVDNDCFTRSDAAVLLEGDGFFRFRKAVSLYKSGLVSKIVFSGNIVDRDYGSYPYEEVKPYILSEGVPEEDLIHEDVSMNTRQQAIEVVRMATEKGWKKLALVASHDHQYRAYLTFLREVLDTKCGIVLYNTPVRNLKQRFGKDPEESEPCFYNQDWYDKEDFIDVPMKDGWFLIRRNVYEESRAVQPAELMKEYRFPQAVTCTYAFFAAWFTLGLKLWIHDFVWCSDTDHNGDRIYVGKYHDVDGVNKNGFSIHRHLALRPCYGCID